MNIWMIGKSSVKSRYLKKKILSHQNMKDITNSDYTPASKVCTNFVIKNLGQYHDLYIQGNALLLADVFENF